MNDSNLILRSLQEEAFNIEGSLDIPVGYIPVNLSTKGLVGAPKEFHIRNFKASEVIALSTVTNAELPLRLITTLNSMIYEDVDVGTWHEKEVEELMLYIFCIFFKNTLTDIAFPVLEEDLEFLKNQPGGEDRLRFYKEGKYVPRTSINITEAISTYDLPSNFNPNITITNKKTGFNVTFSFTRYKDQLVVKRWIKSYFKDLEAEYEPIGDKIRFNQKVYSQYSLDNEELHKRLLKITSEEEQRYRSYTLERLKIVSEVIKIASIIDYNGVDVSELNLSEKYKLIKDDARIDHGMIMKLDKRQKKQLIGIKPEIEMMNPITGELCTRRFSFRISDIISTLQLYGDDEYDDGYPEEN